MAIKELKQFKCPKCGGDMKFDPIEQVVKCELCGHASLVSTDGELEDVIQDQKKTVCPNCGATLTFDPHTQTAVCKFCDTKFTVVEQGNKDDVPSQYERIYPFEVMEDGAKISFIKWLKEGQYSPDDIFTKSSIVDIKGVYIPVWTYSGHYTANFNASIGYDRQETYTEYVTKYSNGRSYKEPVTKTRTVTDWHPFNGNVSDNFVVHSCGVSEFYFLENEYKDLEIKKYSEGRVDSAQSNSDYSFSQLPDFCADATEHLSKSEIYDDRFTSGFDAVKTTLSSESAFNVAAGKINWKIKRNIIASSTGDHIKNIDFNVTDLSMERTLYGVPFWEIVYQYNGKKYVAFAEGTKNKNISGTKPYDLDIAKRSVSEKKLLIFGIIFLVIGLIFIWASLSSLLFLSILNGLLIIFGLLFLLTSINIKIIKKKTSHKQADFERIINNPGLLFK